MPMTADMQGFAAPVDEAQAAFRAILDALANPGTMHPIQGPQSAPPQLVPEAAAVLLTLADYETPLWLSPGFDHRDVREYARFHTGAPLADQPSDASFLFVASASELPSLDQLNIGEEAYPDRSSTVVIAVDGFDASHALTGPGIADSIRFGATGLNHEFWMLARDNHALYPLGVDFLFIGAGEIAGLPRSTRVAS